MRFLGIAARLEPTIAGVEHRSVWPGLMRTFHGEQLTGHTAVILEGIPAMGCDASRSIKIAAKWSIPSHRLAGPVVRPLLDDLRSVRT